MTDWLEATLEDLCIGINDGDWIETKDQGGSDYRLLQVSNIGLGAFRETGKFRYVTAETYERLRCREIRPGMVLVARMPDPVGRAWFVSELAEPAITSVDVAILEPDESLLSPRYCMYLLNSPQLLAQRAAEASGTTRLRVTRKQLAATVLSVPDLPTQKRVESVLGSIDDLIENNRRRVEVLEEMARAIYREWFVHFRFPGHEGVTFVDSDFGLIPERWRASTCGVELDFVGGGTPSKKEPAYWDEGTIDWFTPSDLTKTGLRYPTESELRITEAGLAKSSAKLIPPGTVMMTSRATLGVLAITTGSASTNQGFISVLPDGRWPAHFVREFLDASADDLAAIGTGATFKEITKGAFKNFPFLVPEQSVLDDYRAVTADAELLLASLEQAGSRLVALRDMLLPKLVTGQIDVSDLDLDAVVDKVGV